MQAYTQPVLFLFGAGASAFSGGCLPSAPPIGRDVITTIPWSEKVTAALSDELVEAFRDNFEATMVRFYEESPTAASWMLKDMGLYFLKFQPTPANHYVKLLTSLNVPLDRCVLATTNYDLLIEASLSYLGRSYCFPFPTTDGAVCVLKLHGSCHFLPAVDTSRWHYVELVAPYGNSVISSDEENDIRVVTRAEAAMFCRSTNSIPPAMAIYGPGKPMLTGANFVTRRLQPRFRSLAASAAAIIVVGLHLNTADQHIWDPLAASPAPLYYVSRERDLFERWAADVHRGNAEWLCDSFEIAVNMIPDVLRRLYD